MIERERIWIREVNDREIGGRNIRERKRERERERVCMYKCKFESIRAR